MGAPITRLADTQRMSDNADKARTRTLITDLVIEHQQHTGEKIEWFSLPGSNWDQERELIAAHQRHKLKLSRITGIECERRVYTEAEANKPVYPGVTVDLIQGHMEDYTDPQYGNVFYFDSMSNIVNLDKDYNMVFPCCDWLTTLARNFTRQGRQALVIMNHTTSHCGRHLGLTDYELYGIKAPIQSVTEHFVKMLPKRTGVRWRQTTAYNGSNKAKMLIRAFCVGYDPDETNTNDWTSYNFNLKNVKSSTLRQVFGFMTDGKNFTKIVELTGLHPQYVRAITAGICRADKARLNELIKEAA